MFGTVLRPEVALQFGHLETATRPEAEVAVGLGSGFQPWEPQNLKK
jgi:hypothetical protein